MVIIKYLKITFMTGEKIQWLNIRMLLSWERVFSEDNFIHKNSPNVIEFRHSAGAACYERYIRIFSEFFLFF